MVLFLMLLGCPTEIGLNDTSEGPAITLITPIDGGFFNPGIPVQVCASIDFEGSLENLEPTLASDIDGTLATSGFTPCDGGDLGITVTLTNAVHTLSFTVTDAVGRGDAATALITPTDNVAPSCSVVAPTAGAIYAEGSEVVVTARIDDVEGGEVDVVLDSTLDGRIGNRTLNANANVEFTIQPSVGLHDLVLTATDDRLAAGVCVVSIDVQACQDVDLDGFENCDGDCVDNDAAIYPGAAEEPDGKDNDCDGTVDEGTVLFDDDGDGTNELDGDCDDSSDGIHPGATDVPDDGVDQDCNGADTVTCYTDGDNDGYGTNSTLLAADGDCFDPGEAPSAGDCDDTDAGINPGAAEIPADGIDQDCDGADPAGCFADTDGDGFGSATVLPAGDGDCNDPGESAFNSDCNDNDPNIFPGATEVLDDGIDQNCSGVDSVTCHVDADGDGYGRATVSPEEGSCVIGSSNAEDCDDGAAGIHPAATDLPDNSIDEDCNGVDATTCFLDSDLDGHGTTAMVTAVDGICDTGDQESSLDDDCNDLDMTIYPGAPEVANDGIDQDCDGYDTIETGNDPELYDGIDNNNNLLCDEGFINEGALIVTEVMADPDNANDLQAEWFEVYNTTAVPIHLCLWYMLDADTPSNQNAVQDSSLVVEPHSWFVFGASDAQNVNGGVPVDFVYNRNNFQLSNSSNDGITMHFGVPSPVNPGDGSSVAVDTVTWGVAPRGKSMELGMAFYDASANDNNANWCDATAPYGPVYPPNGETNKGTPGGPPSCTP